MNPQIKTFSKTKFIGKNLLFSFADYRPFELWNRFMPYRNEIQNAIGRAFYNIQINPNNFDFNQNTIFLKL